MQLLDSDALTSSVSWLCERAAVKTETTTLADSEVKNTWALADAQNRAKQWLADAELARAGGNSVWADECLARAALWKVKASKLAARSTSSASAGRR